MGGRIVAAQRQPQPEQAGHEPEVARARHQQHQEDHENEHLDDEHALAAEIVRQAAEADGADEDAEQARRSDHPVLGPREAEFLPDERHGDAGHEHDEALEELAGRGEPPDAPLHGGHGHP
jgi:hypothetical protein